MCHWSGSLSSRIFSLSPSVSLFACCHISLSVGVFVWISSLLNGFVLFSVCVVCPLSTPLPLYIGEEDVWLKSHLLLSNFPLVWQSNFFCYYNGVYYDFLWIYSVHTTSIAFLSVLVGGYLLSQVSSLSCRSSFFFGWSYHSNQGSKTIVSSRDCKAP